MFILIDMNNFQKDSIKPKGRNWNAIAAVGTIFSAIATFLAVVVAIWLGCTSNDISKKAFHITEELNKLQRDRAFSDVIKCGNEIFGSEKSKYASEVVYKFYYYFYLMADISPEKMSEILEMPFSLCEMDDRSFFKNRYGISDANELFIIRSFLGTFHHNEKSKKYDMFAPIDAFVVFEKNLRIYNSISYWGTGKNEYNQVVLDEFLLDIGECSIGMMHDISSDDVKKENKEVYKDYFENEAKHRESMKKRRASILEKINKDIKFMDKNTAQYKYYKALSEFSKKKDNQNISSESKRK